MAVNRVVVRCTRADNGPGNGPLAHNRFNTPSQRGVSPLLPHSVRRLTNNMIFLQIVLFPVLIPFSSDSMFFSLLSLSLLSPRSPCIWYLIQAKHWHPVSWLSVLKRPVPWGRYSHFSFGGPALLPGHISPLDVVVTAGRRSAGEGYSAGRCGG